MAVYSFGSNPQAWAQPIAGGISAYRKALAAEQEAARKAAEKAQREAEAAQTKADKALKKAQADAVVSDPEAMKDLGDKARGLTTERDQWDVWSVRSPGQRGSAEPSPIPNYRRGGATLDDPDVDRNILRLPSIRNATPLSKEEQMIAERTLADLRAQPRRISFDRLFPDGSKARSGQAGAEQTLAERITRDRAEAERALAALSDAGAKGARYEAIRRSKEEQGKQRTQDKVYKPGVQTIEERTTALRMAEIERTNAIKAAAAKEREKALKTVRSGGGKKKPKLTKREKLVKKYEERLAAEVEPGVPYLGIDIEAEKQKEKALQAETEATEKALQAEKIAIQKELVAQSKRDLAELLKKGEDRKKGLADRYEEVNRPWAVPGQDKGWADDQLKKAFAGGDPAIGETLPPHMRSILGSPPRQVYDPADLPVDEDGVTLPPPPGAVSSEYLKDVASDFESHDKDALNQAWWELAGEQAAYNGTTVREEYIKLREADLTVVNVTKNPNGTLDATPMSKDDIRDNMKNDPRFVDTGTSEVIRGEDGTLYERIGGLNYPLHPMTARPGESAGPALREPEPMSHPLQSSYGHQAPGEPNFTPDPLVEAPAAYNLPPPTQVFRNALPRRKPIGGFDPNAFGLAPRWART